jgi:hypothetical protein
MLKPLLLCQRQKDLDETNPAKLNKKKKHPSERGNGGTKERIKHPIKRQHPKAQTSLFFFKCKFLHFFKFKMGHLNW